MRLMVAFLVVETVLAQHSGGFGGGGARGGAGGRGFAGRGAVVGANRGIGRRLGNRFRGSYLPLYGGYGFGGDYPDWGGYLYPGEYGDEFSSPPNVFYMAPPTAQAFPQPAEPVRPARAVIHEYKVAPKQGEIGAGASTFTIALKDGSQRLAVATWIQDGKLHCLDSQGRQQVLSPDSIDRQTTDRLNEEKHLRLQLPPG